MKLQKINLGKVGITVEYDYWDYNKSYDKLTIVQDHSHNTFLSRKPVPKENDLNNRNYWIPVIQNVSLSELYNDLDILKQSLSDFKNEHQENITQIISTLLEHGNSIEHIIQTINEIQLVLAEYATISYVDNAIIDNIDSLKQFISENYIKNTELESSINVINQNIQNVKDELQEDINHKIKETNNTLNEEIKNIKGDEYNTLSNLPTLSNLAINLQNNQLENNNKFDILDNIISNINKNINIINKSNVSAIISEVKWGDSLTVNIKGIKYTLTIPNKPTLSDLTNDLTSLGNVNAGSVNQPVYFKNGVPTVSNILQTNVYDSVFDYSTNGWEEIKGKMYGNRLAITKYRSNPPVFVDAHYDPILSFGNGDVLGFISISVGKENSCFSVGGGLNAHDAPWYWKLKGTNTATYTLPTKSSTLASIDDIPTKLSELKDDVVNGNYLPMAESTYDETDNINVLKHDGSWGIPELAEDLGGREETHHEEFFFQPTAGNDLSIKDGYAKIKSLKGNTIVWNQLIRPKQFILDSSADKSLIMIKNEDGSYTFSGGLINTRCIVGMNFAPKQRHKYLIRGGNNIISLNAIGNHDDTGSGYIYEFYNLVTSDGLCYYPRMIINANTDLTNPITIKPQMFDLTQMFGEGNEPTIEEFETMYPDDYYEYNEGELRSFNGSAIKSVGFNQFNANSNEIIKHSVILNDGNLRIQDETSVISQQSTLSNIKIFPNTTYYVHNIPDSYAQRAIALYDINKIFTRIVRVNSANNSDHLIDGKTSFTTLENEHYCTLGFMDYNKQNVCLNLSHSGYRNGQYEPYKESILQLPIKSIKDDNGDLLFPNGLRSAGTAYDEIVYDEGLGKYKAIKRIGSVDMGSLNWKYLTESLLFYVNSLNPIFTKNIQCCKYVTSFTENYKTEIDKIIIAADTIFSHDNYWIIKDSFYTDIETFKQSLQGQILYYELETPIEVILNNIDLSYEAWDFGTEELVYYTPSTPIITETQYNFNAVDMIRNNYFAIKQIKESNPFTDLATVAHTGEYSDLNGKPDSLKNPNALTITKGDDNTVYDGSEAKQISIPTKTSELTKDDIYSKTEVYTQSEVNELINKISGAGGTIVDTWRPLIIQKNDGSNILSLGDGNTSGSLTLKAGNNITFVNNNGIVTVNNSYSLPEANNNTLGGIKTGGDLILKDGIATVNELSTIQSNANQGATAYGWGNHAGNYPTYYGTGATGTWDININGDAKTLNGTSDYTKYTKFSIGARKIRIPIGYNTQYLITLRGYNGKRAALIYVTGYASGGTISRIIIKHIYCWNYYKFYINGISEESCIYIENTYASDGDSGVVTVLSGEIPTITLVDSIPNDATLATIDANIIASKSDIPTKLSDLTDDYINEIQFPGINKTGTVTSITAGTGLSGGSITGSGTISLATVGTIAGSFGLSANTTPGYSGTFKVPYITVDNYGRVTAISEKTVTMPSAQTSPTYELGYPGTPGLAEPAAYTTDTEAPNISNHKNCYYAVQINGEGKLVVNIPKVYTVVKEIPTITIGEKSKIVYTNTTTPSMDIKLNAGSKNSYTHLYVINNLNKTITITFIAEKVIGPKSIASSSSSGISVDLYVTDDYTIVIEP